MSEFYSTKVSEVPRIPLSGLLHLTYRCNFNCRHCWLRISSSSAEKNQELSTEEIKGIVDQARKMGCRKWMISGGEPMLRDDFIEIFDYITSKAASYSLNTNGSLITPEIAELMKRKGSKMIALYGATPEVSDHITRHPGSFEATMQGMNSLKEAGASFIVQIIPMRDNYHQLDEMINLAKSLSSHWRIGVSWLYLSASRDFAKNLEISGQRLEPSCIIDLDEPDIAFEEKDLEEGHHHFQSGNDDRLFASCIANKHRFNVDPYGKMTFCSFVKDPALRYDLRSGSF